eukprot:PITA_12788
MEDLLVDKDEWIVVDPGTKPTGVSDEELKKLERKEKSTIQLCLLDSLLLNVSGEAMAKALWDKLGTLYQSKSLVNKLFLRKNLYNLRRKDGDLVTEHLNAFNTVVSQLSSIDIEISDEDKCISFLCSLPDSWDSLVIEIGSNATALQFDEIVSSLLMEEMRQKNMESQNGDALSVVCWKCGKEGHYKRDCKSKSPGKGKGSDDAPYAKAKTTSNEGGDVYLASSSTHVNHEAWLIDLGASFHFIPHREWFYEYEKYDGGDVFLGDDSKARIVGHGKVKLKLQCGRVRTLPSVLHIPVLARNLIFVGTLDDAGVKTVFEKDTCKMVQGHCFVFPESGAKNLVVSQEKTMMWHQKLGHIREKDLRILHGKDDFSRNTCIYFLKNKFEVFDRFKEFKALVEIQTEKKIKVLRIDNGGEFCSKEFEEFCKKCGIAWQKTTPHTPQQNGIAEKMKTLMERARSMLNGVRLGQEFWAEAMETSCYLVNISPSSSLEDKTP